MRGDKISKNLEDQKVPLLESSEELHGIYDNQEEEADTSLAQKVWIESKKLWHIVGPSIISRISSYSMLVITQAFAGHLGDLELAAISIANNVIVGFDFGLMVLTLYIS